MAEETPAKETPTFEEGLNELEDLVAKMESGEMGLEEMVAAFERGQKLVKSCNARLDEVERRIEVIRGNGAGTDPMPEL